MQPTSELKREMNPDTLKKIIGWIADHGMDAYSAQTARRDLNIPIDSAFDSAERVIKAALIGALNSAMIETDINTAKSPDELFDLILTFLENLDDYKTEFQTMFSYSNLTIKYISLTPILDNITSIMFKPYIKTVFDKLTYNAIMANIFYTWISDETQDLVTVLDKISHISKSIFTHN